MSNKIWTPNKKNCDKVIVSAKIISAKYHPIEGFLSVQVTTPDNKARVVPIHISAVKFHGKTFKDISIDEVHREMRKTEALFNQAAGRSIKVEMFEDQLKIA